MYTQQALSTTQKNIVAHRHTSPCTSCVSRSLCLHDHLDFENLDFLTSQYTQKVKIKAGDPIFRNGDSIDSLYTVRVGFIKIEYCLPNGHHQVNHFATNGDLIGTDGIANGKHRLDAIALTDGELCSLNFTRLLSLMKENISIQKAIDCAMSRELNNTHDHLYSLGSHGVEQKLAFFILHLHNKLGPLHANLRSIRLPMSRDDLKSYLGVTTESLSRAFTSLENKQYFQVRNKIINDIDFKGLAKLVDQ
jgi:CRP/FNR family transcriptional regulator